MKRGWAALVRSVQSPRDLWFVCFTRREEREGGEGGACDTCKQAWRWVLLLWIDSPLRLLWWTIHPLHLGDQLLFHGLVVFKRKRKKSLDKIASRIAKYQQNYIFQRKGLSFISETQFQALVAVKMKELHGNISICLRKHKPFVHVRLCYNSIGGARVWLLRLVTQKHVENCSYYCDNYCHYFNFNSRQNGRQQMSRRSGQ